jgi:tRNA threonylcarbamoyl adenosine modification protein (Sua5/YciO/YrdC/YwlC family)
LSFVFPDLKEIGDWVKISNSTFRIMKKVLPGKYTFILPASKSVNKSILQKRQTIGVRVPNCEVSRCISIEMGMPILSASVPKGEDDYFTDPAEIASMFGHELDLILDSGILPNQPSSIIDFSVEPPVIIRNGAGDLSFF